MAKTCAAVLVVLLTFVSLVVAQEDSSPKSPQPSDEHKFLARFAGVWDCDTEAYMELGKPPTKMKSSMAGHLIGKFWAIIVMKGDVLGQPYHGQGTFGYDSRKKIFIGTWTDSMSDFLWHYEGIVDGNKLVLNTEGPDPTHPSKTIKARDTWHFKSKELVVLTSEMPGPDGKMTTMMTATCKRKQ